MRRPASRPCGRPHLLIPLAAVAIAALAGCSSDSALRPGGYGARQVAGLWWLLFWTALSVWGVVVLFVGWVLLRRRRRDLKPRGGEAIGFVATAGIVLPSLLLIGVYSVSIRTQAALSAFPGGHDPIRVEVIAHRWWWEVHYPATGGVTANEIHIPVGRPVRVRLTTADVIHSFWVPQLAPKTDVIAGKVRIAWLRADRTGRFQGKCAEYCGLQHAHMEFLVVSEPDADYQDWVKHISGPARRPTTAEQRRGLQVFERSDCSSCHTINGTSANGKIGPNLTTIGSRWAIGAGALPNTIGNLGGWISNSQTVKPGNDMPPQPLGAGDLPEVLAYLESLK